MPGALVDGNDVHAVWRVVGEAVARARSGEGATLIEARTYRWRTHVESEESFLAAPYRTQEEVESWKQRDPISRLEEFSSPRIWKRTWPLSGPGSRALPKAPSPML
ncbi:thiamine pyrophosphate-dependent enzyme [Rhizorhabdus histidinilytica]